MPMDAWEDVAGEQCRIKECTNPATHFYAENIPMCCQCHGGDKYGGLISREDARYAHIKVLEKQGKPIPEWLE